MSTFRRLVEPPRPWHVLLAPALPLLGLFANNSAISSPSVLVAPLLVSSVVAVLLWLIVLVVAKDRHRAALATSILVLAVMSHGTLRGLSGAFGGWLVVAFYSGVLLACVKLVRTPAPASSATLHVNRAFALAALFLLVPIGLGAASRPRGSVHPFSIPASAANGRPDVYVLILDGYAREDVLREQYGATSLAGDLRRLGFSVADGALANYAQTSLALSSALNADYLPQLGFPVNPDMIRRHGLADLIRDNRFFRAFKDAGYYVTAYGSEYDMVRPAPVDERPAPAGSLDEFRYAALEASLFPAAARFMGFDRGGLSGRLHRRHLQWTLDHLATNVPPDVSRPVLVFAHVIAPHPPFVFEAGGAARRTRVPTLLHDGAHWHEIAKSTGESYASGYVDMVRFVNERVVAAVSKIIERRRRPAIFLIHSDHGPGNRLDWNDAELTDMRERMAILLAMRFPDGEPPPLAEHATPVNAYRAVLNRALGAGLPLLEDRALFSRWKQPFAYIDVTDRVSCVECG